MRGLGGVKKRDIRKASVFRNFFEGAEASGGFWENEQLAESCRLEGIVGGFWFEGCSSLEARSLGGLTNCMV